MRMKDKIRRSFDHAAPDVLGKVLQQLPAQKTAPTARPIPIQPKTSRFREFVAAAAALALLVSMVGGTVWYVGNAGPQAGNTDPTSDTLSTEPSYPTCTDPIEPMPEVYVEDLDYLAEDILYPWYLRDFDYVEPEVKTLVGTVCTDDVYILQKVMGSYYYEFHFDSFSGELLAIEVLNFTGTTQKYLSEYVARAIALLNADLLQGGQTYADHCQLIKTGTSGYYCITVSSTHELSTAIYYVHAQTGELLDLGDEVEPDYTVGPPSTEDTAPPDGNIGPDLAGQTALDYLGFAVEKISNFSCTFVQYSEEPAHYLIAFDDETTHFVIKVGAYNPTVLSCEKFQREGATTIMARNYVLDYLGIGIDSVRDLKVEILDHGNDRLDAGFSVMLVVDNFRYHAQLDFYGAVRSCSKLEYRPDHDEPESGAIGWQAARDICLGRHGLTLDDVTALQCQYVVSDNIPDHYLVSINGEFVDAVIAKNGQVYQGGDSLSDTAILTADQVTNIVLLDVSQDIRENYAAGAYDECYIDARVCYGSTGGSENRLYYDWFLYADGICVTYQVDAFTGDILLRDIVAI